MLSTTPAHRSREHGRNSSPGPAAEEPMRSGSCRTALASLPHNCTAAETINAHSHVSRKFAAINNSSASSGATLNSGMFRVVLHVQHDTMQRTEVFRCLGLTDKVPALLIIPAQSMPLSGHVGRADGEAWADKAGSTGTSAQVRCCCCFDVLS